ncbi:MAG: helix-turn-helix transcriptional regulator [Anaerolineae bacterium]|nr:helix-turn-helix transcriptional regulator [Anaerolineae bacterium]
MSIQYAILGFLSWQPLTGYDLKKLFAESATLHWSGNSNQIYKALIDLHQNDWVTLEVEYQADHPPRKVYSITEKGKAALRQWVLSTPELPQLKHALLIQLAWADQLSPAELDGLLAQYEAEVDTHLVVVREQAKRGKHAANRTPRETYLWQMIADNWIGFYEHELEWVRQLRVGLGDMEAKKGTTE